MQRFVFLYILFSSFYFFLSICPAGKLYLYILFIYFGYSIPSMLSAYRVPKMEWRSKGKKKKKKESREGKYEIVKKKEKKNPH